MRARIQRLRAEVNADFCSFSNMVEELLALNLGNVPVEPGEAARAAIALHHGYGAVEALLLRIQRVLEGEESSGAGWHRDLLFSMGLSIEGVRPPVLGPASIDALQDLLAFRHFFRHAYTVRLDGSRLSVLRDEAQILRSTLESDLQQFDTFLAALTSEADHRS